MPQSPTTLYMWLLLPSLSTPPPYPSSSWPLPWTVHLALAYSKTNVMGSDGIPPWFSRLAGSFIAPTLAYLYNLSLRLSVVPVQWKNATIISVPKVAVPVKPADYRPISVLPVFSIILEKPVPLPPHCDQSPVRVPCGSIRLQAIRFNHLCHCIPHPSHYQYTGH